MKYCNVFPYFTLNNENFSTQTAILSKTRLITMRSKPDYVEFVLLYVVLVVLIFVAVHKGLVVVDKSLSDTH